MFLHIFRKQRSPAEKLGDPIPTDIENARARKLRSIHSTLIKKKMKKRVSSIETAIVEGFSEQTELLLQGRIGTRPLTLTANFI